MIAMPQQVGQLRSIASGQELQAMQAEEPAPGFTVLDMSDWQIIPAENLIAAFQVDCIHFLHVASHPAGPCSRSQ